MILSSYLGRRGRVVAATTAKKKARYSHPKDPVVRERRGCQKNSREKKN